MWGRWRRRERLRYRHVHTKGKVYIVEFPSMFSGLWQVLEAPFQSGSFLGGFFKRNSYDDRLPRQKAYLLVEGTSDREREERETLKSRRSEEV